MPTAQTHPLSPSGLTLDDAIELMDSVPSQVAILDEDAGILAVNRAWKAFAATHGGSPSRTGVGMNYLAVCDYSASDLDEGGARFAEGMRRVIQGEAASFELVLSPVIRGEEHFTRARITRLVDPVNTYYMVTHEELARHRSATPAA